MGWDEGVPRKWWYGIEGVTSIWHGEWSDPGIGYKGWEMNEQGILNHMWDWFCEENPDEQNDDLFASFMKMHEDYVLDYLEEEVEQLISQSIIKVYDIDWDDDGECPNLPKDLTIMNPSTELIEATDGFDDCLADYLSDKYGCSVYEFKAKVEIL